MAAFIFYNSYLQQRWFFRSLFIRWLRLRFLG